MTSVLWPVKECFYVPMANKSSLMGLMCNNIKLINYPTTWVSFFFHQKCKCRKALDFFKDSKANAPKFALPRQIN